MKPRDQIRAAFVFTAIFVLATTIGCASTAVPADEQRPEPAPAEAQSSGEETAAAQPAEGEDARVAMAPDEGDGAGGGGGGLADELADEFNLQESEKKGLAEHYYKEGLARYRELNYRDAMKSFKRATELDTHSEAYRQMYDKTLFILGVRKGEVRDLARELVDNRMVKIKEAQAEIERLYSEGRLHEERQDYDLAIERYERVLETIKWFPYNLNMVETERQTEAALSRAKVDEAKKEQRQREELQRHAIDKANFEKARSQKYFESTLRSLFRQAEDAFERKRFKKCEKLCAEVLEMRPNHSQANKLYRAAIASRHRAKDLKTFDDRIEEFARQIESVDRTIVPYQDIFMYPSKQEWAEVSARADEFTSNAFLDIDESPEVVAINNKLDSQRITLNFDATPFEDAIDFLRDITGLNFVIGPSAMDIVGDEALRVSLRLRDITLKNALNLILAADPDLTYKIKNGTVFITTAGDETEELFLEFYNVSDIINDLPNFPAPELDLASGLSGGGGGVTGGVLSFDTEDEDETAGGIGADKLIELVEQGLGDDFIDAGGSVEISGGLLVVRAPPESHRKILRLLEALRRTVGIMVTIESRFIDIQDNFVEQLGFDFTGLPQLIVNPKGAGGPGATSTGYVFVDAQGQNDTRASLVNLLSQAVGNGGANPFNIAAVGGTVLQYNLLDTFQLSVILEAVKKGEKARLINAPRITVFNGQRSHLLAINQRAYIQDVEVNQTGVIPVLNPVIGILNTGSILEVLPTVSYDRKFVTMEVKPTLSAEGATRIAPNVTLAGGNTSIPIELPVITIQKVRTNVMVPDGGTVMVGGLKNFEERVAEAGVPFLASVPVLRTIFTRQGESKLKRSLVILIRADITIIREREEITFGRRTSEN